MSQPNKSAGEQGGRGVGEKVLPRSPAPLLPRSPAIFQSQCERCQKTPTST